MFTAESFGKRILKIGQQLLLLLLLIFLPTSTKPVGTETLRKWNNGLQRASWRWTCFEMRPHSPLCSATDSCWNRNLDSLASPVIIIIILYYAKRQHKHYKCSIQWIKL